MVPEGAILTVDTTRKGSMRVTRHPARALRRRHGRVREAHARLRGVRELHLRAGAARAAERLLAAVVRRRRDDHREAREASVDLTLKTSDGTDLMVLGPRARTSSGAATATTSSSSSRTRPHSRPSSAGEGQRGGDRVRRHAHRGQERGRARRGGGVPPGRGCSHARCSSRTRPGPPDRVRRGERGAPDGSSPGWALGDALAASTEDSRIQAQGISVRAPTATATGIRAMLASAGAKLRVAPRRRARRALALPVRDWSRDKEFDSDLVDVLVDDDAQFVNHLVARGQDEKQNRVSAELYLDAEGQRQRDADVQGRPRARRVLRLHQRGQGEARGGRHQAPQGPLREGAVGERDTRRVGTTVRHRRRRRRHGPAHGDIGYGDRCEEGAHRGQVRHGHGERRDRVRRGPCTRRATATWSATSRAAG